MKAGLFPAGATGAHLNRDTNAKRGSALVSPEFGTLSKEMDGSGGGT